MIPRTVSRDLVDCLKLNTEMIKIIEEKMEEDDGTADTRNLTVKLLEDEGYSILRTASKALGWNFHGSRHVLPDAMN